MDALIFSITIFSIFLLVGFAAVSLFNPAIGVLRGILISPALGVAVIIAPVFLINRMGMPVKEFGVFLLGILLVSSVTVFLIKCPKFPIKQLIPYAVVVLGALILTGRPMLNYGFDWLSFSNDDMANYCLAAQRFLNHGFFEEPDINSLLNGKDYSQAYWFMHAAGGVRSGSELMLAFVWACSGLNAHQIFMPLIMALNLSLISGAGALVENTEKTKHAPLVVMGLLSISPLTSLGTLYQLIGQVGGLAMLTVAVTLIYRSSKDEKISSILCKNIPAAIIIVAIFIWYPEVLPFVALGWLFYAVISVIFRRVLNIQSFLMPPIIIGGLVLIILNKYVLSAIIFMLEQASGGMQSSDIGMVLFPYFMIPSGIPAFWGLVPIAGAINEPFISFAIAAGLVLFYWLIRYVLPEQIKNAGKSVSVLTVMFVMGLTLFFRNNDFGLFKLTMFAQPFLMAVVGYELSKSKLEIKSIRSMVTIVILLTLVASQYSYVTKSEGMELGSFSEIPFASDRKINKKFQNFIDDVNKNNEEYTSISLDTSNIVLAKLQSLYTNGTPTFFLSRNFYGEEKSPINSYIKRAEDIDKAKNASQYVVEEINGDSFDVLKPNELLRRSAFVYNASNSEIFNYFSENTRENQFFNLEGSLQNWLVFHHSKLGNHYYLGDRKVTAFYKKENDPMFPGEKFAALGRNFIFQVINPSAEPRLVVDLTTTVAKQFESKLPMPKVDNIALNFVGRGTGRLYSDPITMRKLGDSSYITIDMGRDGRRFPQSINGLMLLYGRDIPADQRFITTFGRNISLISKEQYESIKPPSMLTSFPSDLANKNLEYSGIYEDGWISEKSFFKLLSGPNSGFITVKGSVPKIDDLKFSTNLKVSVDGMEIGIKNLGLGNFDLKLPFTSLAKRQRVDLEFSSYQKLPGADGRIAAAKINFIGFE